jgi:RecJ-like exonuclease
VHAGAEEIKMSAKVNVKIYYGDTERELQLPGIKVVCERCDGEGYVLNPSIGEHAYSREEFDEAFPEDEDKEQYFKRGGIYDIVCPDCKGKNVVTVIDENVMKDYPVYRLGKLRTGKSRGRIMERIWAQDRENDAYERECEMERRYGC